MRKIHLLLVAALVAIPSGYSAFWYMQATKMQEKAIKELDKIQQEFAKQSKTSGQEISLGYKQPQIGGFPFHSSLTIDDIKVSMKENETHVDVTIPQMHLQKPVWGMRSFDVTLSKDILTQLNVAGKISNYKAVYNTQPTLHITMDTETRPSLVHYQDTGMKATHVESGKEISSSDGFSIKWEQNVSSNTQVDGRLAVNADNLYYDYEELMENIPIKVASYKNFMEKYKDFQKININIDVGYDLKNIDVEALDSVEIERLEGKVNVTNFAFNSDYFNANLKGDIQFGKPYIFPKVNLTLAMGDLARAVEYYADYMNMISDVIQDDKTQQPVAFTPIKIEKKHTDTVLAFMKKIADDEKQEKDFTYTMIGENGNYTIGGKTFPELMALVEQDLMPVFVELEGQAAGNSSAAPYQDTPAVELPHSTPQLPNMTKPYPIPSSEKTSPLE